MILDLQGERQRLDEAIQALERLSMHKARRRNRPPNWARNGAQRQAAASESSEAENVTQSNKAEA